jgi:hypothetical protein
MTFLKKAEEGGDISTLKKEVDSLRKEIASLRKQLGKAPKSSGGADSRVDIILEVLRSRASFDELLKKKGLV